MSRKTIPICVVQSSSINACYQGVIQPHIKVSSAAWELLPSEHLNTLIGHERAHYELYHAELNAAMTLISCGSLISSVWYQQPWHILATIAWYLLWRLWLEIQADARAGRPSIMAKLIEWILLEDQHWYTRLQLKIRLYILKQRA